MSCTQPYSDSGGFIYAKNPSQLITDNHLPHVNGLELVRYARRLKHREELPIIMFSAVDCRAEAKQAGVDVFLRKPEDIQRLIPTINQLLHQGA